MNQVEVGTTGVEVYLNGVGTGGYTKITVHGVTTLDVADFEFS
jgi:hypothetical protein